MPTRIQIRRSTALAWETANPILADGEIALENDTGRLKIGDASTPWRSLRYALDETFSAAGKANLAGIGGHVNRTDNPHATTPQQIGAEPVGAVATHARAASAHSVGSISGAAGSPGFQTQLFVVAKGRRPSSTGDRHQSCRFGIDYFDRVRDRDRDLHRIVDRTPTNE